MKNLIGILWCILQQVPEAPYNNETQALETKCPEACRSNYPTEQRITLPPVSAACPRPDGGRISPPDGPGIPSRGIEVTNYHND